MSDQRSGRTGKFFLIIIFILLLLVGLFIAYKLLAPKFFKALYGEKISELEEKQKVLDVKQAELEEKQAEIEGASVKGGAGAWPWIVAILLAGITGLIIYFSMRGMKKGFQGKSKEEMDFLALDYATKSKGLGIKSFFSRMFIPIGGDGTSWFVWQGVFDAYTPGVDAPSHRCFTVASNNRSPSFIFEDYPNMTASEVMSELEDRHFGRGKKGLPHYKPVKDEPFEGLKEAQTKAAIGRIEEIYKESYEQPGE
jgi:uncharacterized integral membrane protein